MAKIATLPRNEAGIETALGVLKQRFGERFHTSQALREQHGHTPKRSRTSSPPAPSTASL